MTALVLGGCGAATSVGPRQETATTWSALDQAHPQAVDPVAGDSGVPPPKPQPQPQPQPQQPVTPTSPSSDPSPTAAATDTKAPAAGAPTDAELRAAYARFQAAVARYHLNQLNFSGDLINPASLPPGAWSVSIASVYTDYGNPVACGGILEPATLGVANKTLPCGTMVTFLYGGKAIRVPVIDRGPYVAGREWDLTGATAEALGFPGLGQIEWRIG